MGNELWKGKKNNAKTTRCVSNAEDEKATKAALARADDGPGEDKRREEKRGEAEGEYCEILPKVYGRLKGLKARGKLDQGESSPNFHYFQVV